LTASVAIDGSKFKAVNTRDKNFTRGKVGRRRAQLEESAARYLAQLATADRQEPSEELAAKTAHLRDKLVKLESEMQRLAAMEKLMLAPPEGAKVLQKLIATSLSNRKRFFRQINTTAFSVYTEVPWPYESSVEGNPG
jgi:hypothetical protein